MSRFNFKDWNIKALIGHNKETIKAIVVLFAGYSYFAGFDWRALILALAGLLGKFATDTIDYYFSE